MSEAVPNTSRSVLLEVRDLRTVFHTAQGVLPAVDGVSLSVHQGEILALVGESGCGKSVTALSIMRLIAEPPGRIVSGVIMFDGEDLLSLSPKAMNRLRGNRISMIFQEPMTCLNPVFTVGDQVIEAIRLHLKLDRRAARELACEMLDKVGIPAPRRRMNDYPHELSGGMKQRVMISMALVCNPTLLIADEPTTALDVTIQAQILDLLAQLQAERQLSVLLITHDLGIVAELAERVVVMYAGKVVEQAPVKQLFRRPSHPYTIGLLKSLPRLDQRHTRLHTIEGVVPNPNEWLGGCRFRTRCGYKTERCEAEEPQLVQVGSAHLSACHHRELFAKGNDE